MWLCSHLHCAGVTGSHCIWLSAWVTGFKLPCKQFIHWATLQPWYRRSLYSHVYPNVTVDPLIDRTLCTSMVSRSNQSTWQWSFTITLPSAFFWVETNERKWKIILPAKDLESTCKYILNKRPYLWSHDLYHWNELLMLQGNMTFCEEVYGSWSQTCSCIQNLLTLLIRHDVFLRQVIQFKSPFYLLKAGNDYGSWHMGLLWLWSETDTKVNRDSG